MSSWYSTAPDQATDFFQNLIRDQNELNQKNSAIERSPKGDQPVVNVKGSAKSAQNATKRDAWVMTTTEWSKTNRGLVWEANPSDVTWSMPQRSSHTKNLRGTVLHVWPDQERGTFYDEFRLHMNFQSGSLFPVIDGGVATPPGGIRNFYDFMLLVDAPKLTSDNPPVPNLVKINYNSNIFPKITLVGMFDSNGISFTDSSQDPNQVMSWGADFIVYETTPSLSANAFAGEQSNSSLLNIWDKLKIQQQPFNQGAPAQAFQEDNPIATADANQRILNNLNNA